MTLSDLDGARLALAINLDLSDGPHDAGARVELLELLGRRVARVDLSGWVEERSLPRLERAVSDLAGRDLDAVVLDCSRLSHLDARGTIRLAHALAPFAGRVQVAVLGLSQRLTARLRGAADPVFPTAAAREWAS